MSDDLHQRWSSRGVSINYVPRKKISLRNWRDLLYHSLLATEGNKLYFCETFKYLTGVIFGIFFLWTVFNTASSASPQIPLCWRVLGPIPELLRLRHWQADARSHPLFTLSTVHELVEMVFVCFLSACTTLDVLILILLYFTARTPPPPPNTRARTLEPPIGRKQGVY
jgi:hypothetical protein